MTGGGSALELADWRRQISELYAQVRTIARLDPAAAHQQWRTARERLYREHPQSPVREADRPAFRAVHFPYDPALRFELRPTALEDATAGADVRAEDDVRTVTLAGPIVPVSSGDVRSFDRVAWVEVPFPSGPRRLALYWLREYSGGLFLPFADRTGRRETYAAGRYVLDTAKGADLGPGAAPGTIVLDFNFSYQPSCAFDPRWACPLAPPENRLDAEVRAGERVR